MKKIVVLVLALMLAVSLCACMPNANTPKIQTVTDPATTDEIKVENYEDSLEGLCAYFADMGYVYAMPETTGDEMKDPVVMRAEMIGADKGYKFTYTYGDEIVVLELYSYTDTDSDFISRQRTKERLPLQRSLKRAQLMLSFLKTESI